MKVRLTYKNYIQTALLSGLIVLILKLVWPSIIPFEAFQFWTLNFSITTVTLVSSPVILWMVLRNAYLAFRDTKLRETEDRAERFLIIGSVASVWFGVAEELSFRWLIFYAFIVVAKLANLFACGLLYVIYSYIMGPFVNILTLGFLRNYLAGDLGWAVGFAIISSNGEFRNGHAYQGPFGYIQSWFVGMYFFYIMFNYGLVAAMLVHFLVDLCVFIVHYVDLVQGRSRRRKHEAQKA